LGEWREIRGWPGYAVNRGGDVLSLARVIPRCNGVPQTIRGRVLKPMTQRRSGKLIVSLSNRGLQRRFYVHRLVADAFG
jgi:hypothetical protein